MGLEGRLKMSQEIVPEKLSDKLGLVDLQKPPTPEIALYRIA